MPGRSVHTLPFFRSVRSYAYHACLCHLLTLYASLHACLHVHTWVLLASVSSILQHNEVMDIRSNLHLSLADTIFCLFPCLFSFLLVCLLSCYNCYVYHAYLLYASFTYPLHPFLPLLVCWFLVFTFACTHMEWGRLELGQYLPSASEKGADASMLIWAKVLCSIGFRV